MGKHFDFFELARHENGRFITRVDHIDDYTQIRGLAARGTQETDTAWLLERRITLLGVVVEVEYADDAQFTQGWDTRLASFGPPANGTPAALGDTNFAIPPFRIFGGVAPSGLSVAGLVTEVVINPTTWTALPATALTARNAINVQNHTGVECKLNYSNAVVGYEGVIVEDGQERLYAITDGIIIYGKSSAGNITLNIEELS